MSGWERLGRVPPRDLVDARRALHHAAQIVSAAGITHLPAETDDSHTNMEWVPALRALAGRPAGRERAFRLAVRPEGLELLLLDPDCRLRENRALFGATVAEAYDWAAAVIGRVTGGSPRPLERPSWMIPALGRERFSDSDGPALGELARWYGNAAHVLAGIAAAFDGASAVRCWPHHFDLATLLPGGSPGRTVGVGLSPGDDSCREPYWYVSPYPYPGDPVVPTLPNGGRWHRDGFFAAVLAGGDLLSGGSEATQEFRTREFLEAAVADCIRLLRG
ncbi:MAG TPA: hypothetical protein VFS34_00705 [Thermoanaerobaculia bacterium]|nr:hypothetical protein [Thermoanaerobaculia bacterium]